ncbi:MAG: Bug family tripartite tricarboxylate transporter substrate binding protein [Xanthobacteraceae bacterium]
MKAAFHASLLAGVLAAFTPAQAQDYPNRPIHAVIGFAAGSGADIMCRWFTTKISELAGQTVVIDNKPGAFASIAHNVVANAKPDGYTVLLAGSAILTGGRHLIKDLPFDTNSFVPSAGMTETPFVLVVAANSPVKTIAELIARMKSKTGNRYGYANVTGLVATAYLKDLTGFIAEPVSYRVATDALPDIENGTLDFMIIDGTFSIGPVKAGKIKVLAVTSEQHVAAMPGVPTMAEAGIKDFNFNPWWAAYFPAGTPEPIVGKFGVWLTQVVKSSETTKFLDNMALLPLVSDPPTIRARIDAEKKTWDWLAKVANVQPQ